ncbi:MAG: hypothetical protein DRP00_02220 [Candidatus Aenigmatarchaeota archaeon]|nr:MAG: hypothetical protein DRP00_02220 [Candidatus Aenigmarchaeota archaeon]
MILRKINVLCLFYVIFTAILSRGLFINFKAIEISLIALPSFLILPYLFGRSILIAFNKFWHELGLMPFDPISLFTFSWILGYYLAGILAGILTILHLSFFVKHLSFFMLAITTLTVIHEWLKEGNQRQTFHINPRILILAPFVLLVASLPVATIKNFLPFPEAVIISTRTDLLAAVQPAYRIWEKGYFPPEGRWPNKLFPYLMLSLYGVEPLQSLWSAPFVLSIMYAFGLFVLAYALSKRLEVAILSVLFGMFTNIHVGWPGQFILRFKSEEILYSIFPLVLYSIYRKVLEIKYRMSHKFLFFLTFTIVLTFISIHGLFTGAFIGIGTVTSSPEWNFFLMSVIHPILRSFLPLILIPLSLFIKDKSHRGLFLLTCLYSIIFYLWHTDEALLFISVILIFIIFCSITLKNNKKRPLIWLLALGTFIYIYTQWIGLLHFPNIPISAIWNPEIVKNGEDVFHIKKICFSFANREIVRFLLILGGIFTLTSRKKENLLVIAMLSVTLLIYFLPEYHTVRGYKEYAPFMAYTLSYAVYSMYLKIKSFDIRNEKLDKMLSLFILLLILIPIIPTLDDPLIEASIRWSSQGKFVADYEWEAAEWIRKNLPENVAIISDYETIMILTPLGNKMWITAKGMDVRDLSRNEQCKQVMQIIKYEIFKSNSSENAYLAIQKLRSLIHVQERSYMSYIGIDPNELDFIVVISSRTVKWIEQEGITDVFEPQYFDVDPKYLQVFNAKHFKLLYMIDSKLYIFKVEDK